MTYEPTKQSKPNARQIVIHEAEQLRTGTLVLLLLKRHQVALLAVGNIVLVLNWAFPAWTTFISSLFNS